MNTITINKDKCVQCGLCVSDCVSKCIGMNQDNQPYMINEKSCLKCQHCMMICPTGALSFNDKNPENSEAVSSGDILSIIKSRRSIRQFKDEELTEEELKKIKEMLPYIPTGCNSHKLHFSFVENKNVMKMLKEKVNKKFITLLNNKILSPIASHFKVYKESFEKGEDIIFRGAPNMVVVSSPITAPCAPQDSVIALSYIELYANSLGFGTCWCGYAQICMKLFPEFSAILDIPEGYSPIYVMLLGKPAVKYQRNPQPEPYSISEIKEFDTKNQSICSKIKRIITNFARF